MNATIYVITNTVNGKRYVGQTTLQLSARWRAHYDAANSAQSPCRVLSAAIRKYGRAAFVIEAAMSYMKRLAIQRMNQEHQESRTDTVTAILGHYGLSAESRSPIEIPNVGRDPGLARLFADLGFSKGAEIGVERGLFSEALLRENPCLTLYAIDPWRAYRGYRDHVDSRKLQAFYEETRGRLASFNATLIRKFSMDAVHDFQDGSLDFVYIDGNHSLQACINDLAEWSKKVRVGGIIAGHDYARYRLPNQIQVVQAVNAWTDANEIRPWFLVGRQAKIPGEIRDTARSWFWVKAPAVPARRPLKQ